MDETLTAYQDRAIGEVPGGAALWDCAWVEAGYQKLPARWRQVLPKGTHLATLGTGRSLEGVAIIRPQPGMDTIDWIYARPGPRRAASLDRLISWCEERLAHDGLSDIVYAAFPGWHDDRLPSDLGGAFLARGYQAFDAVFLVHDLDPAPEVVRPPEGYRIERFEDRRIPEAATMMLSCPEPEAIYWDHGLCSRSIEGAAADGSPSFPGGLGQQILDSKGRLVCFGLSTLLGYINHVYTLPAHQGRGLGTAVVTHMTAAIRRRGLGRATILTHETNPGARRLYEKLGFRVAYTYAQFYRRSAPTQGTA